MLPSPFCSSNKTAPYLAIVDDHQIRILLEREARTTVIVITITATTVTVRIIPLTIIVNRVAPQRRNVWKLNQSYNQGRVTKNGYDYCKTLRNRKEEQE